MSEEAGLGAKLETGELETASPLPPDNAPVTWGELRALMQASTQYQMSLVMMAVTGVTPGETAKERKAHAEKVAEKWGSILEKAVPGATGGK